jgi:ATP-binding cassette subfamily B protein
LIKERNPLPRTRLGLFLRLLREHRWSYLAGALLLALTLWMTFAIPRYLHQAIDILRVDSDPSGSEFLHRIGLIVTFAILTIATRSASRLLFFVPGRKVEFDLKNRLLTHLTTLQRNYYMSNPSGAIISRINNDINGVRMLLGIGMMMVISSIGTLSLAPYYMYQISPSLTLYCAVPIVLGFALLQVGVRRMRKEQQNQMRRMQHLSDFTVESYNGIDVLKANRALGWALGEFGERSQEVRDSAIRMSTVRAYFFPLLTHITNGLKVVLVLVGGVMVVRAEMTIGGFTAYTLYLSMLVPPLMGMTFMMFLIQRGMTSLGSLLEVSNNAPDLPPRDIEAENALSERLRDGIELRGLSFAYDDEPQRPVLEDISLQVRPGEVVGLFGPVGSGKTTIVNLINRYLTPPVHSLFIDGVDARGISLERLRQHAVTVSQEPFLFSDTIRENIAFGTGQIDDDELDRIVDQSSLREDISRMPAGVETVVGEKGITLSGGQKQRIALARALRKPCDLLILDDVLSAVDYETERFLIDSIYREHLARSLLVVSHRISALERADRVVIVEEGRITDSGSHLELIARDGIYRETWLLQRTEEQLLSQGAVTEGDPPRGDGNLDSLAVAASTAPTADAGRSS